MQRHAGLAADRRGSAMGWITPVSLLTAMAVQVRCVGRRPTDPSPRRRRVDPPNRPRASARGPVPSPRQVRGRPCAPCPGRRWTGRRKTNRRSRCCRTRPRGEHHGSGRHSQRFADVFPRLLDDAPGDPAAGMQRRRITRDGARSATRPAPRGAGRWWRHDQGRPFTRDRGHPGHGRSSQPSPSRT